MQETRQYELSIEGLEPLFIDATFELDDPVECGDGSMERDWALEEAQAAYQGFGERDEMAELDRILIRAFAREETITVADMVKEHCIAEFGKES